MANIDLLSLFNNVSGVLKENKTSLNKADDHNGDHGDHMVQIFEVITKAMKEKSGVEPADQLAYASKLLKTNKSGSAKLYTKGLGKAAKDFAGQSVTQENVMQLIQSFMGGGETHAPAEQENPHTDLLEGILGSSSANSSSQNEPGLDVGDLLSAGMAFLSAKKSGDSNIEALVEAVVSATPFAKTAHRQQSSQLVVDTLLTALSGMQN